MIAQATPEITKELISESLRLKALPYYFRQGMPLVEPTILDLMRKHCQTYNGAYWDFYKLSNGGFFMAPCGPATYALSNADNYADVELSAEAAGLAIALLAYSHLSFVSSPASHIFSSQFHWVREFALNHPEAEAIFRFID